MPSIEVMSHLMREENEHQREREREAQQQFGWMCNPGHERRKKIFIRQKQRLVVAVMELHPPADDRRAEQGQKQEQSIEPPARTRRACDPYSGPGLLLPFEGGRKRGCGFGHERSEVRG